MSDHQSPCMHVGTAEKTLALVIQRQDHMDKDISGMKASQALFEAETRASLHNIDQKLGFSTEKILEKIDTTIGRVHARIDGWIRAALGGTLAMLVLIVAYIWKTQVG